MDLLDKLMIAWGVAFVIALTALAFATRPSDQACQAGAVHRIDGSCVVQ